jgi:hypothetical protein
MPRSEAKPERLFRGWRALLLAALLTCVLALYNHFPLTYSDTGNYLDNARDLLHGHRAWIFFRPLTYGVFLMPFASSFTLWLLPLAQGLLIVGVVDLALRSASVSLSGRALVGLFAVLSSVTSLSWFSGQIMPDIFTPIVILLSFVLVWTPRSTDRTPWPAFVLLSFAIATHLSHFPIYGVLLFAGLGARVATDPSVRSWHRAGPLVLRAGGPLAVALLIVIAPNYVFHRQAVLSRSSSIFALAHLVEVGAAQRYLERVCPARRYALCAERTELRADMDWFLWSTTGPWARSEPAMARGDSTFLREAPSIVAGTLRQEWPAVLAHSLRATARQLVTFEIHPGEHAFSAEVAAAMERLDPGVARAYRASRQVNHGLPVGAATRLHYTAVGAALLALLWCLRRLGGPRHWPFRVLVATVFLGLVVNAGVVASLATVHPRYQSRVAWLVVLVGALAALQVLNERGRAQGASVTREGRKYAS